MARHGTYTRKTPSGVHITRYYCREGHTTFSLLPDCLASRLPGELSEVEQVVRVAEGARSLAAAADVLRPDIELPGALRWLQRRVRPVHLALLALVTLWPLQLGSEPRVHALGVRLETEQVLVRLRGVAASHLCNVTPPLGLRAPGGGGGPPGRPPGRPQQKMGADRAN